MSLKKWLRTRRLTGIFAVVFLIPILSLIGSIDQSANIPKWQVICVLLALVGFVACFIVHIFADGDIRGLRRCLGVKDLRPYRELSPSQMEDLCLKRLQALATTLVQAQGEHSMPLAVEITKASHAFRHAYWFFETYKFIKPTPWARFFPEPETKK